MASDKGLTAKTVYLILYNFTSAVLWATVLGRTALVTYMRSPTLVHLAVADFAKWTQTLAALEIAHSLVGTYHGPHRSHEPS